MEQLQELWLDNNRLTALPMSFLYLTRLRDLRLDGTLPQYSHGPDQVVKRHFVQSCLLWPTGNVDMVHPSLDVIGKGIPTILKWCAIRKRNSKAAR
jgi:hypothetical protein